MTTIDTITVKVSTLKFDSLVTNDAARYLVGYHEDADLGLISSAAYFQLGIDKAFSIEKQYTTYSRSELLLVHDGYSAYDTITPITFSVHKVTQKIESDDYLFNTSSFKYDPTPLGTVTYKPKPHSGDTLKIPLTDDTGRSIIALAQAASDKVATSENFIEYFYGLVLVPSAINGPIVGFNVTAQLKVYYTDRSVTPSTEKYLSLTAGSYLKFNKTGSDASSTNLTDLKRSRYPLSSKVTGNKAYIQCGVGLGLRISLPYLRNLLIENPNLTLVSASLEFSPSIENDDERNMDLPAQLSLSGVDYRNDQIATYTQPALLYEDFYLGRDTHYEVDISGYVKSQLETEAFNDNAILISPDNTTFRSTLLRLYVGDQQNERALKVKLTCLTYKK